MDKAFWAKVSKDTKLDARGLQCWVWTAAHNRQGYGVINIAGDTKLAHRVIWEEEYGSVSDGKQVNHHCDNPPCIRLSHLYAGTHQDNMRDMVQRNTGRKETNPRSLKTHCPQGHPYNEENTYLYAGTRGCRVCSRVRHKRRREVG